MGTIFYNVYNFPKLRPVHTNKDTKKKKNAVSPIESRYYLISIDFNSILFQILWYTVLLVKWASKWMFPGHPKSISFPLFYAYKRN